MCITDPENLSSYPSNSGKPYGNPGEKIRYVDTHVSTGTSLLNVGTSQEVPGLKKLAKVMGRSTIGYQHHHQAENSDSQKRTESEPKPTSISELQRNVTPHLSEKTKTTKTYSKVKEMALRIDKTDPGRNSVENTDF